MSTTPKREEPVANFTHAAGGENGLNVTGREAWRNSEPRLPLFTVTADGGEEDEEGRSAGPELITYTIPAKPNPGLALDFLRKGRQIGPELAISWLIEETIGAEGYDALVSEMETYDGDGSALLGAIGEKIQRVVMGGLENPKA